MISSTKSNIEISDVKKILKLHFPNETVGDYIAGYEAKLGHSLHITAHDRKRLDLYFLQKAVTTYVEGYRYDDAFRPRVQGYMGMRIRAVLDRLKEDRYEQSR